MRIIEQIAKTLEEERMQPYSQSRAVRTRRAVIFVCDVAQQIGSSQRLEGTAQGRYSIAQQVRQRLLQLASHDVGLALDVSLAREDERLLDVVTLDAAMTELGRKHHAAERAMMHHLFGGLTSAEISDLLQEDATRIFESLRFGRAFLLNFARQRGS